MAVIAISIGLTSRDIDRLAAFYRDAFGFTAGPRYHADDLPRILGADGAHADVLAMQLGDQTIELAAFSPPGRPYPPDVAANDVRFQHAAIVVSDMAAAYARLKAVGGWTAMSRGGPQHLPESSGGVTAFKFRDPEGHPLELLEFTAGTPDRWRSHAGAGPCLGIDHTAITVGNTARSTAFYRDLLGLTVAGTSLNRGAEQEHLDSVRSPIVQVTSLRSATSTSPGVELLSYRRPAPQSSATGATDVAATRLVIEVDLLDEISAHLADYAGVLLSAPDAVGRRVALAARDPDGHIVVPVART